MALSGSNRPNFGANGIIGLVVLGVVIFVLLNIVGWIISLLYKVGWIFWIAAAVIDHTVVTGFAKSIFRLFERNWIMGLVAGVLSVALYPFVGMFLVGRGLFRKQLEKRFPGYGEARRRQREQPGEVFTDFEEVPRDPREDDFIDFEELPPAREPEALPRTDREKDDTGYDELFR